MHKRKAMDLYKIMKRNFEIFLDIVGGMVYYNKRKEQEHKTKEEQKMKIQITQNGATVWDDKGKPHYFPTEEEAQEWIDENKKED